MNSLRGWLVSSALGLGMFGAGLWSAGILTGETVNQTTGPARVSASITANGRPQTPDSSGQPRKDAPTDMAKRMARLEVLIERIGGLERSQAQLAAHIEEMSIGRQNDGYNNYREDAHSSLEESPELVAERAAQTLAALNGALDYEQTDPEWAAAAEGALEEVVLSGPVAGVKLVANECRSSLCRLELAAENPTQLRALLLHLPWSSESLVTMDDAGNSVLYLSREGHGLPQ